MTTPPWLELLDRVIDACAAQQRPDLAGELGRRRARLLDPTVRVLVLGEPNRGKSQLINALVNAQVCPVDDDVTGAGPTVVRHAESPSAVMLDAASRVPVPVERLTELRTATPGTGLARTAEVGIPRRLLAGGLVLVDGAPLDGNTTDGNTTDGNTTDGNAVGGDTAGGPDTGPPNTAHGNVAAGAATPGTPAGGAIGAAEADVVVLASQATDELSATELALLRRLAMLCPELVVALTKIDLAPRWRLVAERNRARLAGIGVTATVIPVSAELRMHAARTGDHRLNAESGFAELVEWLQRAVTTKPTVLAPRSAAVATNAAIEQLIRSLRTEPAADSSAELQVAQRNLDQLRAGAARRLTLLADRMADLSADLDYDLRDRARRILREVDKAFDVADPAYGWAEFHDWLDASLADAAEANFGWFVDRCRWIAETLRTEFPAGAGHQPPPEATLLYEELLDEIGQLDRPRLEPFSIGQRTFTGLRGSYGGVLMFGLATSLTVGLPLLNPISLAAGVLFGGKSIKEEAESRLRRRQGAAKAAVQRYVDDFFLRFGKDSKDALRQAHRAMRDHVAALGEALQRELAESMDAARQSAHADAVERERRHRDVEQLVALHRGIRTPASLAGRGSLEISA